LFSFPLISTLIVGVNQRRTSIIKKFFYNQILVLPKKGYIIVWKQIINKPEFEKTEITPQYALNANNH